MEVIYKCPICKKTTMGIVQRSSCGSTLLCPHCQKIGKVSYMCEQHGNGIENIGDGLFKNRKEKND